MNKYFSFNGIAGRSEYWGVNVIIFILMMISYFFGMAVMSSGEMTGAIIGGISLLVATVFYIWCFLAVTVKRCRDANINAWWTASTFVPYVGIISWIVIGCLSTAEKNEKDNS